MSVAICGEVFLPASSLVFLNTTERKRPLRPTPHTCGLPCGLGVWWFWPRKHHQLVSYLLRILERLAWSWPLSDEAALATWPAPTLRRPRQR